MSMSDPIADMLTRIRNAQLVQKTQVTIPASKVKSGIAAVLKQEGYINDFRSTEVDGKPALEITLRYMNGRGVIETLLITRRPTLHAVRGRQRVELERVPWLFYGAAQDDLPAKLDGIRRFGDDVIQKLR